MAQPTPVVAEYEVQRFVDLGLGRGVDATNLAPWHNKSSYLVRKATSSNVIGTEEGSNMETYKTAIFSSFDLQLQLSSSLSVPNTPVSVGVEVGVSRGTQSRKTVLGNRIATRTISFHLLSPDSHDQDDTIPGQKQQTFEEGLSEWLLNTRGELKAEKNGNCIQLLANYMLMAKKEDLASIVKDCFEFIRFYGVTHYVSAITLGASEHTVMTEAKYSKMLSEGFDISASSIGSANQKLTIKSKSSSNTTNMQHIGKITDGTVERGSTDEAVIGVKILPVHSLIIKNRFLFLAMNKALVEYMEDKSVAPSKSICSYKNY